jgi:hypothetical protein
MESKPDLDGWVRFGQEDGWKRSFF